MKTYDMAKNRITPDRPVKKKDNCFSKSKSKFNSEINLGQNRQNRDIQFQNKTCTNEKPFFKPSKTASENFFVKPTNSITLSKVSDHSTINVQKQDSLPLKREKKPFDKKKYRLKKYSKKYKLQQWEDQRKKAVLQSYYKTIKEDERSLNVKKIYEEHADEIDFDGDNLDDKINEENENNLNVSINQENLANTTTFNDRTSNAKNSKGKKNKAFWKAHHEFQRIKEEKEKKKEEKLKQKTAKQEALEVYKKKKIEKYKKLNKKTKRGQPIMKDRIEMLLEKIQSSIK